MREFETQSPTEPFAKQKLDNEIARLTENVQQESAAAEQVPTVRPFIAKGKIIGEGVTDIAVLKVLREKLSNESAIVLFQAIKDMREEVKKEVKQKARP